MNDPNSILPPPVPNISAPGAACDTACIGLEEEGEDIEVMELGFEQAVAMVRTGEICDGKTIMLLQYLELRVMSATS